MVAALALAALFSTRAMWRSVRLANVSLLALLLLPLLRGRWCVVVAVAALLVRAVPALSPADHRADRLRVLLPGLAAAATSRRPWPVCRVISAAVAVAVALARTTGASPTVQALLVATEVLALAACAALLLAPRADDGGTVQARAGSATV